MLNVLMLFFSRFIVCKCFYLIIFGVFSVIQSDQNCLLAFSVIASNGYIGQFGGFML